MVRRAFVTGGTGVVGRVVLRRLLREGYEVCALTRWNPPEALSKVRWVQGELGSRSALERGVEGADVVFHLAALLHQRSSHQDEARYLAVNVHGTEALLEAAARAGAPRVVLASTINVYGAGAPGDEPFTEGSPLRPATAYARSKCAAEGLMKNYANGTILRLAAVYGSTMKGNYFWLARWFAAGGRWLVGDGRNRRTLVHAEDVAEALLLATTHPAARGATFNVTDGKIHTLDQIARAIQTAQGRKPGLHYLSDRPLRAALGASDAVARRFGRPLPGREMIDKLTEDMAVSGLELQRMLGFSPRIDLATGWSEALTSTRRNE